MAAEPPAELPSAAPVPDGAAEADRFPCPKCGAEMQFDPARRATACTHCGHAEATVRRDAPILEYDLGAALAAAPRVRRRAEMREVSCTTCGARVEVPADAVSQRCGYCDQPVVLVEDDPDRIAPESLLPFVIGEADARRRLREWMRRLWFRPSDLARQAEVQKLRGRYVPAWTFDADTASDWTAMAGYYYYVSESYTAFENGKSVRKTRQVRKIRWQHASGHYPHYYDDWLVWGSKSLAPHLLDELGSWPLRRLVPYDTSFLAGLECERYHVDLNGGWEKARDGMADAIESACASRVPGDTHRDLRVRTTYRAVRWKHLLLPLWVIAYRYGNRKWQIVVNGQTGKVDGEAPLSWTKILGFVLLCLLFVGGIVLGVWLWSGR